MTQRNVGAAESGNDLEIVTPKTPKACHWGSNTPLKHLRHTQGRPQGSLHESFYLIILNSPMWSTAVTLHKLQNLSNITQLPLLKKSEDNLCVSFLFPPNPCPLGRTQVVRFLHKQLYQLSHFWPDPTSKDPLTYVKYHDACFSKSQWKLPSVKLTILLIFILPIVHHRI